MSYRYGIPVRHLQRVLSPEEFMELKAEEELCPRGEWREDLRAGRICATIANFSGRSVKTTVPHDFMPDFTERFRKVLRKTGAQIRLALERITLMLGGTLKKK